MNLLLVEPYELSSSGTVELTDRRFCHLRDVLKVTPGSKVRAGVVRGPVGTATVESVGADSIELAFHAEQETTPPQIDLVLALPRPKALSRMVQAASSFGTRRIDIINAWRVDSSYFKSHKTLQPTLLEDARLGCEQGRLTYVPEIQVHRFFKDFIDETLAPRLKEEPLRRLFVGHPTEAQFSSQGIEVVYPCGGSVPVTLVIGPDGGFVARELQSFLDVGGTLVHFGEAILRSENALVAGLSQLCLLRRLV